MKRIIALLAVILVGLTACTKIDMKPEDGQYISVFDYGPEFTITLSGGKCVSVSWPGGSQLNVRTSGRYPKYTYTAGDEDSGRTYFDIAAKFSAQSSFTASISGLFLTEDGGTAVEYNGVQFMRVSADFQQTNF